MSVSGVVAHAKRNSSMSPGRQVIGSLGSVASVLFCGGYESL